MGNIKQLIISFQNSLSRSAKRKGNRRNKMKTKIVIGPFGPHYAKKMFYYEGKWHFLKWMAQEK